VETSYAPNVTKHGPEVLIPIMAYSFAPTAPSLWKTRWPMVSLSSFGTGLSHIK